MQRVNKIILEGADTTFSAKKSSITSAGKGIGRLLDESVHISETKDMIHRYSRMEGSQILCHDEDFLLKDLVEMEGSPEIQGQSSFANSPGQTQSASQLGRRKVMTKNNQ